MRDPKLQEKYLQVSALIARLEDISIVHDPARAERRGRPPREARGEARHRMTRAVLRARRVSRETASVGAEAL